MINAQLNKTTYTMGDEIQILLDFGPSEYLLEDVTNINVDIFSIERERNNFAFGFGYSPETSASIISIHMELPENFKEGLYLVGGIKLIYGENYGEEVIPAPINDITRLFFWFSKDGNLILSEQELTEKINKLDFEREKYTNALVLTDTANGQSSPLSYRVLIFGVGCLLHSSQNMEGYTLHPLRRGYSYSHIRDAVNSYTTSKYGITLENIESIESSFSSSTPLFVIDFSNVQALDYTDAGSYCSQQSENIYTVLAFDRGQRPNSFATIIIDVTTGQTWQAFHFPGYRGNLVSDFNPASTAQTLDRLLPKLNSSPWLDLIMRIYADAKSELNPYYASLKFWSILEMISKKKVKNSNIELSYPDGNKIYDSDGKIVTTKFALGKAYKYVLDSNIPSSIIFQDTSKLIFETYENAKNNPNYDNSTKVVTLWETLSALYEIRNATAHSGKFDSVIAKCGGVREKLAAELWDIEHQTFLREVREMIKMIVSIELNS